jgi:Flp pilus assembly protein TadG
MKMRETFKLRGWLRSEAGRVQSPSISSSISRRILSFLRRDSDGSAIMELALALPVYLIIITGTVSTVMALYAYQQLAFATFTASEVVGAGRGTIVDPCATVATNVVGSLPTWNANSFIYTIWISQNVSGTVTKVQYGPYTTASSGGVSCTGTYNVAGNGNYSLYNAQNEPVTVRVSYQYNWYPIYAKVVSSGPLVAAESSLVR